MLGTLCSNIPSVLFTREISLDRDFSKLFVHTLTAVQAVTIKQKLPLLFVSLHVCGGSGGGGGVGWGGVGWGGVVVWVVV